MSNVTFKKTSVWLLVFFLTCVVSPFARAQTKGGGFASLHGYVYEKGTKKPILAATISIQSYGLQTRANDQGFFVLKNVPVGIVDLTVQCLGMESQTLSVNVGADKTDNLIFYLEPTNFRLKDVQVIAVQKQTGASTASFISRNAIDHMQTNSLKDLMQLLPGQVAENPTMSDVSTINIRSVKANDMNSMGAAIVMDGVPISNNANLQLSSTAKNGTTAGFATSAGSGIDLRQISTDNIESVEVIRGIPSVQYGDITSGVVIVNSKAGKEPLDVRLKMNPNTTEVSAGEGIHLGEKAGNLNVGVDYTNSVDDQRKSYQSYGRLTGKLLYSNTFFKVLHSTWSLDLFHTKDNTSLDPDDALSQKRNYSSDNGFRFSTRDFWSVNDAFLKNIKFTFSAANTNKKSYSQGLLSNALHPISTAKTDGTVAANTAGLSVTDADGNTVTHYGAGDESAYSAYLPSTYLSQYTVYGKEWNIFSSLQANFFQKIGSVNNRIVLGTDYKTDGNNGLGMVYDINRPPHISDSQVTRPRAYKDIPWVKQLGAYAEDNIHTMIADRTLALQLGLRFDRVLGVDNVLSPRLNASFDAIPQWLTVRGGYGITAKAPTVAYLYPNKAYFDIMNYNNLGDVGLTDNQRLIITTTHVYDTKNYDLKIATNQKSEVGFDVHVNKMRFSFTGYYENLRNGYTFGESLASYKLVNVTEYQTVANQSGTYPLIRQSAQNNVFYSYNMPLNSLRNTSKGIEFDFDFGRIDAIRTSFSMNGAWQKTSSFSSDYSYYQDAGAATQIENHPDLGLYAPGNTKSLNERLLTTARIVHNIPELGFVISLSVQTTWVDKNGYKIGNDSIPVAYVSKTDGKLYTFTSDDLSNPRFKTILKTLSPRRFIWEDRPPLFLFNLHLTKEIGQNMGVSFFANNLFANQPRYKSKVDPSSYDVRNPEQYFGLEFFVKIR